MEFEWDSAKARENESKHGVSFFEACEVFGDDHSLEENRYLIFGMSKGGKYLVVSYTERVDRIRLISVRQMTPRERRAYEQR